MKHSQSALAALLSLSLLGSAGGAWAEDGDGLPAPKTRRTSAILVTEFDPVKDGLAYVNVGSFKTEGGDCLGMSLVSVRRFLDRMGRGGDEHALAPPEHDRASPLPRKDLPFQATAALVQMKPGQDWSSIAGAITVRWFSDPAAGLELFHRMRESSEPQVVSVSSDSSGHAVVVYGYRNGEFLVYDPNKPRETVKWSWDAIDGFGHSPFLAGGRSVGIIPRDLVKVAGKIGELVAACDRADTACVASFAPIAAKIVKHEKTGYATARGKVDATGGLAARRIIAYSGDEVVGIGAVASTGEFDFTLAGSPESVRLVAVTQWGQLVGFRDALSEQTRTKTGLPPITPGIAGALSR